MPYQVTQLSINLEGFTDIAITYQELKLAQGQFDSACNCTPRFYNQITAVQHLDRNNLAIWISPNLKTYNLFFTICVSKGVSLRGVGVHPDIPHHPLWSHVLFDSNLSAYFFILTMQVSPRLVEFFVFFKKKLSPRIQFSKRSL